MDNLCFPSWKPESAHMILLWHAHCTVRKGEYFSLKFINETNESLFFVLCVAFKKDFICLLCNSFREDYTVSLSYYYSRINALKR